MSEQQAMMFLGYMIGRLGGGYHPDNSLIEYVYVESDIERNTFSIEEVERLQPMHDEMLKVLGDKVYTHALFFGEQVKLWA